MSAQVPGGVDHWTWNWTLNEGASFWDNPIADVLRVVTVIAAMIVVMHVLRVLKEERRRTVRMPMGQRMRFVALGVAVFSLAATEISVFGSTATPRLPVTLLCLGLSTYGIYQIRQKQKCAAIKDDCL
jgi:hypothetical protein